MELFNQFTEQIAKVWNRLKVWQEEKSRLKYKIGRFENFQKLVLEHSDEVILDFINDAR